MTRQWRIMLLAIGLAAAANRPGSAADLRNFDDADLHAAFFLDASEGWVVGDQGTVWHTMDAGAVWERQPTGCRATLTGIQMLSHVEGWISARESLPYNPGSAGQVLSTRDGGGSWVVVGPAGRQYLSGLRVIHFIDSETGFLLGENTDPHPTGIFSTIDSGASWTAIRGPRIPGWTAGLFLSFDQALLAGHGGAFYRLDRGRLTPLKADWLPGTSIRDLTFDSNKYWAVGDQGQILFSSDGSRTWVRARTGLAPEAARVLELRTVAAKEGQVWAAGRPGSVILHSPDAGQTWHAVPTGQSLPIDDLAFVNGDRGWAVGALGTILATTDGGKTWSVQRPIDVSKESGEGAKRRAGILWITADGRNIPLSAVARYGGDQGIFNAIHVVTSPDISESLPGLASRSARLADAVRSVGGADAEFSSASRFPIASGESDNASQGVINRWNQLYEGKAQAELERELTAVIRQWRPSLVVIDGASAPFGPASARTFVIDAARRAFAGTGNPAFHAEQISQLGLTAHAPTAMFATARDGDADAAIRLDGSEVSAILAESYADAADTGAALLHETFEPGEQTAAFRLVASTSGAVGKKSIVDGLAFKEGIDRRLKVAPAVNAIQREALENQAQTKRNLLALIEKPQLVVKPEQLLGNLVESTESLGVQQSSQVIYRMGAALAEKGNWPLAHSVFEHIAKNYPQQSATLAAYQWLLAYQTSSEARLRSNKIAILNEQDIRPVKPNRDAPVEAARVEARDVITEANGEMKWNQLAINYGDALMQTSPQLWADPRIQLSLAAARRRVGVSGGDFKQLNFHYRVIAEADPNTRWKEVVEQERWFFERKGTPARPVAMCVLTSKPPYLDGKLDDECWARGKSLPLIHASGETEGYATRINLRYDDKYIYVAARCAFPDPSMRPEPMARENRDADLTDKDRVELLIDLDRDYTTFYRLRVDQHGRVADDCWNDSSWDPNWFVAATSDEASWSVEAAIPRSEITDKRNLTNEVWAFNVMRVIPGRGVQALTTPASAEIRTDGFCHLRFTENEQKRAIGPQTN